MRVEEHTIDIDHVPVFYREAASDGNVGQELPAPRDQEAADSRHEESPRPRDHEAAHSRHEESPGPRDHEAAHSRHGKSPRPRDQEAPRTTAQDGAAGRERDGSQPPSIVYLHGAGTSSDIWEGFLELTGGLAPDLIGFGRSGKGGHLDYGPEGLAAFLDRWAQHVGLDEMTLVGHGWGGAVALLAAAHRPERVRRLVLINAVPLLAGFRWPPLPSLWRRRVAGELVMGATGRWLFNRQLRSGTVRAEAWSRRQLDALWEQFDQGTQRALLRLHRAADEARLAQLGARLDSVRVPALVIWGERDPWLDPHFADAYGTALAGATVQRVAEAGHWPWLDRPEVMARVAEFVAQ